MYPIEQLLTLFKVITIINKHNITFKEKFLSEDIEWIVHGHGIYNETKQVQRLKVTREREVNLQMLYSIKSHSLSQKKKKKIPTMTSSLWKSSGCLMDEGCMNDKTNQNHQFRSSSNLSDGNKEVLMSWDGYYTKRLLPKDIWFSLNTELSNGWLSNGTITNFINHFGLLVFSFNWQRGTFTN